MQVEEEISGVEGTEKTDEIDEKESQTQGEVEEKAEVILAIFSLLSGNVSTVDLSNIGESSAAGRKTLSKNIGKNDDIGVINQSVTGFFTNIDKVI